MPFNASSNSDISLSLVVKGAPVSQDSLKTKEVGATEDNFPRSFPKTLAEAKTRHEPAEAKTSSVEPHSDGNELPQRGAELPDDTGEILELDLESKENLREESETDVLLAVHTAVESRSQRIRQLETDPVLPPRIADAKPDLLLRLESSIAMLRGAGGRQIKEMTSLDVNNTLTESNARTESVQSILPRTETAEIKPLLPQRAELSVPVRVGSTNWGESIAGRLSLMVNQRISAARIHISPPELGPIEVRVNLNGDQASVQFVSHSAQVRDALEQSIPRLREMLEDAGFTLEDSDVSDQSSGKNSRQQSDSQGEENQELVEQDRRSFNPVSIGLIDQFV